MAGRRSGDSGPVVEELGLPQGLDSQVLPGPPLLAMLGWKLMGTVLGVAAVGLLG